jgi:hypothetical protein
MQQILFEYELSPTTWAYLSALMTLGIYFKFRRFWSLRNLDLAGLIAFSLGLLAIYHSLTHPVPPGIDPLSYRESLRLLGYSWLFGVGLFFVVRLMLDPLMVRRPLLEPNLNASGLTFTAAAVMFFLMTNILSPDPPPRLEPVLAAHDSPPVASPGFAPFYYVASFANSPTAPLPPDRDAWPPFPPRANQVVVSRVFVIAAQIALVLAMLWVGYRHFDNLETGVAAASLYLLLPYTGQMVGRVDHVLPAALMVWAMGSYRRPLVTGLLMGTVAGLIFYPFFLLPLYCSFYWRRGLFRFLAGFALAVLVLVLLLAILAPPGLFCSQCEQMFGGTSFLRENAAGFWESFDLTYRIPIFAVFAVLAMSLGLWPAQKNLGTLLSCSATLMLATQFWHLYEGGLYMAWYLPLLTLTIFRPNLEDRVAVSAVVEGRTTWPARILARLRRRV